MEDRMVTALIIVIAIALVSLPLNIILNCKLKNERADNSYELQKIEKQYTSNISDVVDKYGKIVAEKDNMLLWARFHGKNGQMIAEGTEHWVNGVPMSEKEYQQHLENKEHPVHLRGESCQTT
jgi:hypothetical protein